MAERADFEGSYRAIESDNPQTKSWRYYIPVTIEPAVFLFGVSTTMTMSVTTDLYLVHTCENSLGYEHSVCQKLADKTGNDSKELEIEVQHATLTYTLGKSLIEAIIPALLSSCIGPWSDLNGRKPLMMWSIIGFAATYTMLMVGSLFPDLPVVFLMLCSLPTALCGGFVLFLSGVYSYITDVSTEEKRSLRMSMVELSVFVGFLVGNACSSYIYNAAGVWGYVVVYEVAIASCILSWIYCWLFVQESVINNESTYPCCCLSHGLFKTSFMADMLRTCIEKRPNYCRAIILMLVIILGTCVGTLEGETSVSFLFTREKFGWDLQKYTEFVSINIALCAVGIFFGNYVLDTWLGFSPSSMAAFGFGMKAIAAVIAALSPQDWYLYVASVLGLLGACVGPWCRSILSKAIPKEDIGKVFAVVSSLEALAPLATVPVYTFLYNTTIQSFSGAFFLLSAGQFVADVLLLIVIMVFERRGRGDQYLLSSTQDDVPE